MHRRFLVPLLLPSIAIALLSACATGPSVATPDFDVTVQDASDSLGVFGVGFLMADVSMAPVSTSAGAASTLVPSSLSPTDVVDVGEGLFVANAVLAEDGATVGFFLPEPEELPSAVLVPVESAFYNAEVAPDCAVSATPSSANVTAVAAQGFVFPGLFLFGIDGLEISIVAEDTVDLAAFPSEGERILSWVYSDSSVVVDFVGTDCDLYVVDSVELDAGWNTLQWTFSDVGTPSEAVTISAIDQPDAVTVTTGAP